MDWTKIIGSVALMAGAITGKIFSDLPNEIIYIWASIVPALWIAKPVVNVVSGAVSGAVSKLVK